MLTIENKKLTNVSTKITNADTVIELICDVECTLIGVLVFVTGEKKILNFSKIDNKYKARLIITTDDIKHLKTSKFYVLMISGVLSQQTNTVELEYDIELIKQTIRITTSNDILELKKELKALENKLDAACKNGILNNVNIKNKTAIAKGMIPVTIDDKGNCVFMFPFQDFINEINGQKAVNGSIEIDANMIKYLNGKTIGEILASQGEAFVTLSESFSSLANQLSRFNERLGELEQEFATHKNNGII